MASLVRHATNRSRCAILATPTDLGCCGKMFPFVLMHDLIHSFLLLALLTTVRVNARHVAPRDLILIRRTCPKHPRIRVRPLRRQFPPSQRHRCPSPRGRPQRTRCSTSSRRCVLLKSRGWICRVISDQSIHLLVSSFLFFLFRSFHAFKCVLRNHLARLVQY